MRVTDSLRTVYPFICIVMGVCFEILEYPGLALVAYGTLNSHASILSPDPLSAHLWCIIKPSTFRKCEFWLDSCGFASHGNLSCHD